MRVSLAALLAVSVAGCKSKQDAAIEQAKQKAVQTGQEQQVVSTDKNGNTVTTTVEPPQPGQSGQVVTTTVTPKATTPPASATAPVTTPDSGATAATTPAPAAAASATATTPPPPPPTVHVAAGTALVIRIDQRLSAKGSRPGERFTGEIHEPVTDDSGNVIVPKGSPVKGRVDAAQGRGNFKGAADLKLRLTSLTLNGKEYPLDTHDVLRTKKGKGKRSAGFIGGGAGLGLLLGGIAGGGKGAAIGGLAGAGAGTIGAGATGNKDLVIPAESIARFKLKDELVIEP